MILPDLVRLLREHQEWREEVRRLVLSEELLNLPALVQELSRLQEETGRHLAALASDVASLVKAAARADERIGRLEEAHGRLENAVAALADAQRRTEEQVGSLGERVGSLEEHVDGLKDKVDELGKQVGRLQQVIGATMEEEAESVLLDVLERKGYQPLGEPVTVVVNGDADVAAPVRGPDGRPLWAVVEAKTRQSRGAIEAWANRMRSQGFRARLDASRVSGPYLVYAFGMRVDSGAAKAAEAFGMGLMTGRGERIAPRGVVGLD